MPRPPAEDGGRALDVEVLDVDGSGARPAGRSGDTLESRRAGMAPNGRWQRRWGMVPARRRRAVVAGAALVVAVSAVVVGAEQASAWYAEREARQQVRLTTALGVFTSSSTPRGGHVTYYVELHNDGVAPLQVTSVRAADDRLRLLNRRSGPRDVAAGADIIVPLSVVLTCAPGEHAIAGDGLEAVVDVVRKDGTPVQRRQDLAKPQLVRDVATTLCSVRPELRGYELSGPIIRPAVAAGGG